MQEGSKQIDWKALTAPFPPEEIEWRIQLSGKKEGRIWAMVCAYITNRAIMERLDAVAGPANWKNRFELGPAGEIICGLSIRVDGEWIEKCDGADRTQVAEVKGGMSSAMKRAGVQWGIGRYLYDVETGFAKVHDQGKYFGKAKTSAGAEEAFRWDPPRLPDWALPESLRQKLGGSGAGARARESAPAVGKSPDPDAEGVSLDQAERILNDLSDVRDVVRWINEHVRAVDSSPDKREIHRRVSARIGEFKKAA